MPSKKQYDLVSDDGYDSRIPLHSEEAFQHGIEFQAKYIGTLDVPRPSSRVEIVAAMRRIRYEFKAKAIKKKKVCVTVTVDGVKVALRKKKSKFQWDWDENRFLIMKHPIYRIFYVSHDSQDLKIWSYIARDGSTNVFKCNVFKSYKKNQAMKIVRTIGQAFEVCHKISAHELHSDAIENTSDCSSEENEKRVSKKNILDNDRGNKNINRDKDSPTRGSSGQHAQQIRNSIGCVTPVHGNGATTIQSPLGSPLLLDDASNDEGQFPLSNHHQIQLLRQQLEQQQQQTQVAIAQVHLLKDQLSAETAARLEAQARAHQLLLQNKDLLEHITQLVGKVQDFELKSSGYSSSSEVFHTPPQVPFLPDSTTPQCGPVFTPELKGPDNSDLNQIPEHTLFENRKTDLEADSPDSGHKEMSSESLALNVNNGDHSLYKPFSGYKFMRPYSLYSNNSNVGPQAGNPFIANSREMLQANNLSDQYNRSKFITPMPSAKEVNVSKSGSKVNTMPKLDPPPKILRTPRNYNRLDAEQNGGANNNNDFIHNEATYVGTRHQHNTIPRCRDNVENLDNGNNNSATYTSSTNIQLITDKNANHNTDITTNVDNNDVSNGNHVNTKYSPVSGDYIYKSRDMKPMMGLSLGPRLTLHLNDLANGKFSYTEENHLAGLYESLSDSDNSVENQSANGCRSENR